MAALFEKGQTYTFFFSREHGDTAVTGKIISYESPLVKIETEGLTRVINCSSAYFVEAVTRREEQEAESSAPAE